MNSTLLHDISRMGMMYDCSWVAAYRSYSLTPSRRLEKKVWKCPNFFKFPLKLLPSNSSWEQAEAFPLAQILSFPLEKQLVQTTEAFLFLYTLLMIEKACVPKSSSPPLIITTTSSTSQYLLTPFCTSKNEEFSVCTLMMFSLSFGNFCRLKNTSLFCMVASTEPKSTSKMWQLMQFWFRIDCRVAQKSQPLVLSFIMTTTQQAICFSSGLKLYFLWRRYSSLVNSQVLCLLSSGLIKTLFKFIFCKEKVFSTSESSNSFSFL